jgi:hypothetical protein
MIRSFLVEFGFFFGTPRSISVSVTMERPSNETYDSLSNFALSNGLVKHTQTNTSHSLSFTTLESMARTISNSISLFHTRQPPIACGVQRMKKRWKSNDRTTINGSRTDAKKDSVLCRIRSALHYGRQVHVLVLLVYYL